MDILLVLTAVIFLAICFMLGWSKIEFRKGSVIVLLSFALIFNGFYMGTVNGYKNGQVNSLKGKNEYIIKYTKYVLKRDSVNKKDVYIPCDSIIIKK